LPEGLGLRDVDRLLHDLRSPVNSIMGRIQQALRHTQDATARRHLLRGSAACRNLLRRFQNLHDLLALRQEADFPPAGSTDLAEAWEAALYPWRPLAEALGVRVVAELPEGLSVGVEREVLLRMLDNLLSNVFVHAEELEMVSARVDEAGGRVDFSLRNDGVLEGEGELEVAVPDLSAGPTLNGLGLPVVKALAEKVGGGLQARHGTGGSFIVTLTLPAGQ